VADSAAAAAGWSAAGLAWWQSGTVGASPQDDEMKQFVEVVLASTEDAWTTQFRAAGKTYKPPRLVLFSGQVRSACGYAEAAMGPFYCPSDSRVYIDLSFYDELRQRFHAPGDFAQAYVIAHEVGHHVQNLLGIMDQVEASSSKSNGAKSNGAGANATSVRLELQADCFAGVWAFHANQVQKVVEPGDVEEALNAASAIGDDRLQEQTQGNVVPDSFTHGTSAQRVRWFQNGLKAGDVNACDTFNATQL
jgi:predicted metalloprotease